ncbi:hypothetical protein ZIOFF_062012 [Zingiber officinale]|uniref:Uncharacterized protein n=1 Tax=Zingiber officinale TaxID=94328 RepID=A0A8J5F4P1_ZINOF|nr:hypothetical protein ZIOFF_062012 [Zingiber officinale]
MADDDQAFPAGNAAAELNRDKPDQFPTDSVSSNITAARKKKETAAAAEAAASRSRSGGKCELGSSLKSTLVISGVVIVAVGVAFFVAKKLKQT